ncbi:sigma-70 family RNA polymerase sigma factor [Seleniivibrio woodruffii]|uniref:RNA polymerase primary sigma factor n=1 Tax=Seleniivibrio woodruffii TaxID=1078050 RepID=A0A4R1K8D8_9BACT|nr:RNA polymerase sigma factor RpoD/SigA [Seleniivibrio woodruffii]TCK60588.1 RNA polymerase primary sigma factor [Seleniivibrio woodruffii]TVZ36217.1 RNA polymerase primary sigma factor [Seleniivibrio woodruffii]
MSEETEETLDETEQLDEEEIEEAAEQAEMPAPVSENSLKQYLNSISRYKPLTKEQEYDLGVRIAGGDQEALNKLILSNLKFVVSIANRYKNTGLPISDLINQGNLGLVEAAKRFDHTKDVKFISYAVWWIRQSIIQALAEQSGTVKLPIKQAGILYKINGAIEKLNKQLNREPNSHELAEYLKMEEEDIENVLRVSRNYLSLEAPIKDGEDRSFIDLLESGSADIEEDIIAKTLKAALDDIVDELDERESQIISWRFGLDGEAPRTLEEIGEKMQISRERVRQLETRALAKLRKKAMKNKLQDFLN